MSFAPLKPLDLFTAEDLEGRGLRPIDGSDRVFWVEGTTGRVWVGRWKKSKGRYWTLYLRDATREGPYSTASNLTRAGVNAWLTRVLASERAHFRTEKK